MRILFVQGGFGAGGAEKVIAAVANHRAGLGDDVHVLGMRSVSGASYFPYAPQVSLHVGEVGPAAIGRPVPLRRLASIRRQIRASEPDIVISFLTKINALTLLAGIGLSVPTIISERNNPGSQKAHPAWHRLQFLLARRARGLVMLTETGRQQLPRALRDRAVVIHNPCEPIVGVEPRPIGTCRNLVAVGRLDHQKGFDRLLRAFARMRRMRNDLTLTIFGEGPERASLEAQIDTLDLGSAARLAGVTDRPGAWVAAADLLLVTSRHEGFCNVVAEATVSGVPVISFDCDFGPRDLISHDRNGFLVPEGDIEGLVAATMQLVDDPERRAAYRAAATINLERLHPDRILSQWDTLIRAAVHPTRGSSRTFRNF